MSVKNFKDPSLFEFTSSRGEESTVRVLNANTNNNLDSIDTSDSILVSSTNNHVFPNKELAATLPEASSSLDSMKLKTT